MRAHRQNNKQTGFPESPSGPKSRLHVRPCHQATEADRARNFLLPCLYFPSACGPISLSSRFRTVEPFLSLFAPRTWRDSRGLRRCALPFLAQAVFVTMFELERSRRNSRRTRTRCSGAGARGLILRVQCISFRATVSMLWRNNKSWLYILTTIFIHINETSTQAFSDLVSLFHLATLQCLTNYVCILCIYVAESCKAGEQPSILGLPNFCFHTQIRKVRWLQISNSSVGRTIHIRDIIATMASGSRECIKNRQDIPCTQPIWILNSHQFAIRQCF